MTPRVPHDPDDSHGTPTAGLPLFRSTDPETSREAAEIIAPHLSDLQRRVLAAFRQHGPMTALQVERLAEFDGHYGFSTLRKRVSELHKIGALVQAGVDRSRRAPLNVYKAKEQDDER